MFRNMLLGMLLTGSLVVPMTASAHDQSTRAAIGGGLGGALGGYLGAELGGREGAILGGGLGGATGAAISTRGYQDRRYQERRYDDRYHRGGRYQESHHHYYQQGPRGRSGFCPPGLAKQGRC